MSRHTIIVSEKQSGSALGTLVRDAMACPWSAAKRLCARGKVSVDGVPVADPGARVMARSEVVIDPAGKIITGDESSATLERERVLYIDSHLVVIDKPSNINSVPFEEGERGTLVDKLATALHRWELAPAHAPLFVVHRLDRDTTGVMVFGRTWLAKRHLAALFRAHDIERSYEALVNGLLPGERRVETRILEDRGDGLRGAMLPGRSAKHLGEGRKAVTNIKSLAMFMSEGGATRVLCTLETGRQHQIRIHLAEQGNPVIGERVYSRGYKGVLIPAPRAMLHARTLGFTHPADGRSLRFESSAPKDYMEVLERLSVKR